jgi:hypothetical protein
MNPSLQQIERNISKMRDQIIKYNEFNYNKTKSVSDIQTLLSNQTLSDYDELFKFINSSVYEQSFNSIGSIITAYTNLILILKQYIVKLELTEETEENEVPIQKFKLKEITTDMGINYIGYLLSVIIMLNLELKFFDRFYTYSKSTQLGNYLKTDSDVINDFIEEMLPSMGNFNFEIKIDDSGFLVLPLVRFGDYFSLELNNIHTLFFILKKQADTSVPISYPNCNPDKRFFDLEPYNYVDISFEFSIIKQTIGISETRMLSTTQDVIQFLNDTSSKVLLFNKNKSIDLIIRYYGCYTTKLGINIPTYSRRQFILKKSSTENILDIQDPKISMIRERVY